MHSHASCHHIVNDTYVHALDVIHQVFIHAEGLFDIGGAVGIVQAALPGSFTTTLQDGQA